MLECAVLQAFRSH